jgi:hypothetical protein
LPRGAEQFFEEGGAVAGEGVDLLREGSVVLEESADLSGERDRSIRIGPRAPPREGSLYPDRPAGSSDRPIALSA